MVYQLAIAGIGCCEIGQQKWNIILDIHRKCVDIDLEIVDSRPWDSGIAIPIIHLGDYVLSITLRVIKGVYKITVYNYRRDGHEHSEK